VYQPAFVPWRRSVTHPDGSGASSTLRRLGLSCFLEFGRLIFAWSFDHVQANCACPKRLSGITSQQRHWTSGERLNGQRAINDLIVNYRKAYMSCRVQKHLDRHISSRRLRSLSTRPFIQQAAARTRAVITSDLDLFHVPQLDFKIRCPTHLFASSVKGDWRLTADAAASTFRML
jgi:hypothetical protein